MTASDKSNLILVRIEPCQPSANNTKRATVSSIKIYLN